ncbi:MULTISPECIES: winged helix-turn-helix domain-containing protein [Bacillus]|uniref:DNA-binding winged helix-turn-helix (WHTH) protein n=1 Tax=Bacillus capparidis TaxID=1840411 RepID=A0ABS4CTK7_9BACI|nr:MULTISPECIES: winged helix-turn-helix domain-containing protein [Bacillus]MBP1080866.1 DNA-binding winged helix-turn-helix (wHTH) protein [Bacillus capparidis]MED1097506.1 winged helix-turn-helix domain-containing protein [Bacillus capparidis]
MYEAIVITENEYLVWILEISLSAFKFKIFNTHDLPLINKISPRLLIFDFPSAHQDSNSIHNILKITSCPVMLIDSTKQQNISDTVNALKNGVGQLKDEITVEHQTAFILRQGLIFDIANHCIQNGNDRISLSTIEFKLLYCLVTSKKPLTSDELIDYLDTTGPAVLYVYIKKIREKIEENPCQPKILINERGKGYLLKSKEKHVLQESNL